jgi:hypothetical protein
MEGTSSLTIESHNLSERLRDDHLEALVEEVSETVSISVEESGGEALVSSVKEGEKIILGADSGDISPLSLGGVDTSGVMGTGVEEDDRSGLGVSEILEHTVDVESLGLGVEVSVLVDLEAGGSKDGVVVTPGRVGDINRGVSELSQEGSEDVEGTGSGKSLGGGNSSTGDIGMVPSEESTSSSSVEVGITINGSVFFIEGHVFADHLLGLADNGEDVRLSVVVTVGTDTKVNFLGEGIGLETGGEGEDRISGGLLDVLELRVHVGEAGDHGRLVVDINYS